MATKHHDPLDKLGIAYEKILERASSAFHNAEEKTEAVWHHLIDDAKEASIELKEVSKDDAEKISAYIRRDIAEASSYMSETGSEFREWLGFEAELIEDRLADMFLKVADKTTIELLKIKKDSQHGSEYHTGEVTGPGMLVCSECGEILHFHKPGKIPPCPKCHSTVYQRSSSKS